MNILVTGAAGFIGSNLIRWLLANTDHTLICIESFKPGMKSNPQRLQQALAGAPKTRYFVYEWDLTHTFSLPFIYQLKQHDIDVILNVASDSHVTRSITNPAACWFNNTALIYNMLDLAIALRSKLKAFIQVSTDEVYGDAGWDGPAHAEWDPIVPSNPYSASKAAQEALAISYFRTYGIPVIITNTMNVIGLWQDPEKFVPKAIKRILNEEQVEFHADITTDGYRIASRVWLDVENMACAMSFIIENLNKIVFDFRGKPPRFHLVGDTELSVLAISERLATLLGKTLKSKIVQGDNVRPGYDRRYALSDNNLKALGYTHPISLDDSLAKIINWVRQNPNWVYE